MLSSGCCGGLPAAILPKRGGLQIECLRLPPLPLPLPSGVGGSGGAAAPGLQLAFYSIWHAFLPRGACWPRVPRAGRLLPGLLAASCPSMWLAGWLLASCPIADSCSLHLALRFEAGGARSVRVTAHTVTARLTTKSEGREQGRPGTEAGW